MNAADETRVAEKNDMESDKRRYVINGRSIVQLLPILDNKSRNILASGKLKSDENLRVTWLFFSQNDEICRLVEIAVKRRSEKSAHSDDYVNESPWGVQVHDVAIHCTSYNPVSENGGGPDEGGGGRGGWVISRKSERNSCTRGSTWQPELGPGSILPRTGIFLLASVHNTLVRSCRDAFLPQPSLSQVLVAPICVWLWSQTRWGCSDFSSINQSRSWEDWLRKKSYRRIKIIFPEKREEPFSRQWLWLRPIIFAKYTISIWWYSWCLKWIRNEEYFSYYFFQNN